VKHLSCYFRVGFYIRLERICRSKHSSLFALFFRNIEKRFITFAPGRTDCALPVGDRLLPDVEPPRHLRQEELSPAGIELRDGAAPQVFERHSQNVLRTSCTYLKGATTLSITAPRITILISCVILSAAMVNAAIYFIVLLNVIIGSVVRPFKGGAYYEGDKIISLRRSPILILIVGRLKDVL